MNRYALLIVLAAFMLALAGITVVHSRTSKFVTADGRADHTAIQRHINGAEP